MKAISKVALVTGATGFVGRHLCQCLLTNGWELHAVIRSSSDITALKSFATGAITYHYYDGLKDDIIDIVREVQPTVVFHLASLFLAHHKFSDIINLIQSNIVYSTHLVEAMVQNNVFQLINTGTSWQHYNTNVYNPVCLYAATKQAFQDILKFYQDSTPLKVITLKLFDTYGIDDTRPKLLSLLKKIAQTNETMYMSPGDQLIDLVYIDDVIDAFLMAAEYLQKYGEEYVGEYAVTSRNPQKLKDIVHIYESVLEKKLSIEWGGRPYREREVMNTWEGGKVLPNWQPKFDLYKGFHKVIYSNCK